jgi:TPR repeat protein
VKHLWKFALPVVLIIVTLCAVGAWHSYKTREYGLKLAEDVQSSRARALEGDSNAEEKLGGMYYYGQGVSQDYSQALQWYRKAADQGNPHAQYGVGYMYESGKGIQQDFAEASRWYEQAVGKGDRQAECGLAAMYYDGRGVPQDRAKAAILDRRSADQGLARAEYDLGYMYYYGQGVPQDRAIANYWYRKAADQGNIEAQHALGVGLTSWRVFILMGLLIGGILLTAGLLIPRRVRWSIQTKRTTIAGVLCFFSVGLDWYGFTHSQIGWMLHGFNAFSLTSWLLNGVLIVLLISILRSGVWRREPRP